MNYLIASDLHGSAYYTELLLARWEQEPADRLLLLGDLLYHGPRNDLPKTYAPKQVIAQLNPLSKVILACRGNCDAEVDQMVLDFPLMSDYVMLEEAGHTIFMTHGHVYDENRHPYLVPGSIVLHGHTHIPALQKQADGVWYVNPGSVAIPKGGSQPSYMTLTDGCLALRCLQDGSILQQLNLAEL
ncbi:MAG: phosphodiesterase [Oscillospiraceae bacterium]|nr:phosphodiesterase [Oscillospiraceae bacterium]MDD4369134.1 phosphodiesterase [Oscillospiraceae bacterium]